MKTKEMTQDSDQCCCATCGLTISEADIRAYQKENDRYGAPKNCSFCEAQSVKEAAKRRSNNG